MKPILLLLMVALIVELVVILPGQLFDGVEPPSSISDNIPQKETEIEGADQFMKGVHLTGTKEQTQEWELWAERAKGFKEKNVWRLDVVKSKFFPEDGGVLDVSGDTGEVELESKNLSVLGSVIIRSSNGYKMFTSKAIYTSSTKTLVSPDRVRVVGPAEPNGSRLGITGDTMTAQLSDSYIWIRGQVHAKKVLDDGRIVNIQSDEARLSGKDNSVKFAGNVIMDLDNMRATGPQAKFQYMEDGKSLESVFVDGGVRVSDLDKWATSENVTVNFQQDKYTFVGSPRVVQNDDELRGQKIIFTNGGKRVQILKARVKVGKKEMERLNN